MLDQIKRLPLRSPHVGDGTDDDEEFRGSF
jgi:hypothetical protein